MRGFLLLSLGVFSFSALAADLPGSHDLDVLPRFPRAEIVDFRQAPSEERIYPLGAISRISGRLRMEGEVRAEGELTALTYRLPPEHSSQEAFAAARTALLKADATPLFWCERRDCGSSSLLANAVFGNAKLYGPDEQQAYLLVPGGATGEQPGGGLLDHPRQSPRLPAGRGTQGRCAAGELLPSPATLLRLLKANGELTLSPGGAGRLLAGVAGADPAPGYRGAGRAVRQARPGVARRPARAGRAEQPHGAGPVGGRGPAPQLAALNAFARARAMVKMPSARPPARVDCLSPRPTLRLETAHAERCLSVYPL